MDAAAKPDSVGIYLHIPFCRQRCGYCSFSITTQLGHRQRFLELLSREIAARAVSGRGVDTIYFGGGTPSLLLDDELAAILSDLRGRFDVAPDAEITLEANPEDLSPGRARRLHSLGVNRLSIGVQSLDDAELAALDRCHDAARALAAVADAVAEPGLRVSVDLMLGTPGQTAASARRAVQGLLAAGVGHLSLYVLETDQPSRISREVLAGRAAVADDDAVAGWALELATTIRARGLARYEVSSFARPGEESRHNLRYWRRRPYLGLGPAAASFDGSQRRTNVSSFAAWVRAVEASGSAEDECRSLTDRDDDLEAIFLGLREARGVVETELGAAIARLRATAFARALAGGFEVGDLARVEKRIAFTDRGFLRMNLYLAELFE